jgi:hypothetical protein
LVRVKEAAWAGGHIPNDKDPLEKVQAAFLERYWNADLQELSLREFDEAKITYRDGDPTFFIQQLDNWHARLSALTHIRLSSSEIVKRLIEKMPAKKRDLLKVGRCHSYSDFKSLVINVVHPSDFRDKEPVNKTPTTITNTDRNTKRWNNFGNRNNNADQYSANKRNANSNSSGQSANVSRAKRGKGKLYDPDNPSGQSGRMCEQKANRNADDLSKSNEREKSEN